MSQLVMKYWILYIGMISKSDTRFFKKARQIALISDFHKVHIGCIAVYKNRVIAVGYDTNKTSPLQAEYNKYRGYILPPQKNGIHAEMSCLIKIKDMDIDFSKVILYIYREDFNGNLAISRPCMACEHAIRDYGIKHIHYTGNMKYIYEEYV